MKQQNKKHIPSSLIVAFLFTFPLFCGVIHVRCLKVMWSHVAELTWQLHKWLKSDTDALGLQNSQITLLSE